MFPVQLLPEKVTQIIPNKEALNNKAYITQIGGCLFCANSAQKSFEAQ